MLTRTKDDTAKPFLRIAQPFLRTAKPLLIISQQLTPTLILWDTDGTDQTDF